MELRICKNCNTSYSDSFCNHCGQKTAHRITLSHIVHDITHAFTHADKGIINLFIQLFINPGKVAREYVVEGKRKRYFNPFQYLLIIASITAFVVINTHYIDHMMASNTQPGLSKNQLEFIGKTGVFLSKYFNLLIILQLPFFSIASYLMYRRYRFNFAEHLTLHTFITAQATIISTTMMLITTAGGNLRLYMISSTFISIAYYVFTYIGFFKEHTLKGGLKALFCNLMGMLFHMLTLALLIALWMIIFIKLTRTHGS